MAYYLLTNLQKIVSNVFCSSNFFSLAVSSLLFGLSHLNSYRTGIQMTSINEKKKHLQRPKYMK